MINSALSSLSRAFGSRSGRVGRRTSRIMTRPRQGVTAPPVYPSALSKIPSRQRARRKMHLRQTEVRGLGYVERRAYSIDPRLRLRPTMSTRPQLVLYRNGTRLAPLLWNGSTDNVAAPPPVVDCIDTACFRGLVSWQPMAFTVQI